MVYKIPKRLLESKEQILKGFSSKASTAYDASSWQKHFKGDSDFEQISQVFPTSIRRIDLEGLSREVRNGGYAHIRKLFLASMIWGYVKDDRRGAWRTKQMLSYHGAQEVLKQAARWVSNGQIIEACRGFKLPWCGSVFSTKFFYFIGLGAGISPLPCILDDRVGQSLEQLGREEGWNLPPFNDVYGKGIERCPEGYIQYIQSLDEWAKELGCRADYIEYFLYSLATGSSRRRKRDKEESMKSYLTLEDVKNFAKQEDYKDDINRIESLKRPVGGRYREFRFGKIGEYLRVFEREGSWTEFETGFCHNVSKEKIQRYKDEAARFFSNSGQLSAEEAVVQVRLPKGELEKLREKAKKLMGVDDPSTLARIWILERLT